MDERHDVVDIDLIHYLADLENRDIIQEFENTFARTEITQTRVEEDSTDPEVLVQVLTQDAYLGKDREIEAW